MPACNDQSDAPPHHRVDATYWALDAEKAGNEVRFKQVHANDSFYFTGTVGRVSETFGDASIEVDDGESATFDAQFGDSDNGRIAKLNPCDTIKFHCDSMNPVTGMDDCTLDSINTGGTP